MEYFISTNRGSDTNPGTKEQPWRTLERANAHQYESGDHLLLHAGERYPGSLYFSPENVIETKPKRFEVSYYWEEEDRHIGPSGPVIDSGRKSGVTIRNLNRVKVCGLHVWGGGYDTNTGFGVCILNDAPGGERLSWVIVDDVHVSGFRWAGIYVGGIPNDLPGFTASDECRYGYADVSITDCSANENMYYGIYVSGPLRPDMTEYANENVTIELCMTRSNHGDKYYTTNHSGSGILLDNCQTGRIEYCQSSENGAENAGQTGGPCGIWAHASDRITIARCKSYANRTGGAADGTGFDLDGGVTNSVIEHCETWDNDGPGYLMWNYEDAPFTLSGNIIRDCVSTNDGRKHRYGGIHLGTSGKPIFDIYVRDCTVTQSPAPDGASPACLQVEGTENENIVFRGNRLFANGGVPETRFPDGASGICVAP